MQSDFTYKLIEELTDTLEKVVDQMNTKIDAFGKEIGSTIISIDDDEYDDERTDWKPGQLVSVGGGGLKRWDAEAKCWRWLVNGVESVEIVDDMLVVTRSNGLVERSQIKKAA
jgi:hypothetical protein